MLARNWRSVVLFVVLLGSRAYAQHGKYTRQPSVRIDVGRTERTKPLEVKQRDKSEIRPELSADAVLAVEIMVTEIRKDQEAILQKLIAATPDSLPDEKANYYFLLAELYAKQQRVYRLQAAEAAITGDKAKTPGDKAKAKAASDAAAAQAQQYLVNAVKVYRDLTENSAYANFAKQDRALFYYGYTLQSGRYYKEARAAYDKLLRNYPASKYVPDAHLAFAEYYFEAGQFADAEARYKHVLKFPKSPLYWYAMYKLGWIHLNLSRHEDALESFFQVAQGTKGNAKQEALNRVARKDFVRAYAYAGKVDKALDAFRRVDSKSALAMLEILADFYLEQGKSDKGVYTYRELMKAAPTHRNACMWQFNVTQLMMSMAGATNVDKVAEIQNLNKLYAALAPKLPKAEAQECHDNAAAMSGEHAREFHYEASRTKNPETLGYAEKLYKIYLDTFPAAANRAETQYYYAELLWARAEGEPNARLKTQHYEHAGDAFTAVVKTGKLDAKLTKEAAYAAVLAWMRALDADPRKSQHVEIEKPDAKPVPKPIAERDAKLLAAVDAYITYVKDRNDEELVGMKFLKGRIFRRFDQLEQAIPIFKAIVTEHRDHEVAEEAAMQLLDSYNRLLDYKNLVAFADQLLANQAFLANKPTLEKTAAKIKITSLRLAAEQCEKEARASKRMAALVSCGEMYVAIYNANPEADGNDEVLYNAGVCFEDGRSIGLALRMYGLLEQFYPKSKHTARATARMGNAYGNIARYDLAADKLEQYAKKYAGEKDAHDAMNDSVFFTKGIGEDTKALERTKFYIRQFGAKKPAEAADAHFSMTSIYDKQGDPDAVVNHLREYIRAHGNKGGAAKLVIANARIGEILFTQSCPTKEVAGACIKITRERAVATRTRRMKRSEQPRQCGPESKIKVTVVARDARKVREAMQAFAAASRAFAKVQDDAAFGGARHYHALGQLAEATVDFEKYLALAFPANLDLDHNKPKVREKSLKRFNDWFEQKTKLGAIAAKQLDEVLAIKDSAASIAAFARLGQITQHFSDALFTAEIPHDVRTGAYAEDKVQEYCDMVTDKAEPLARASLEKYGVCLSKSTELGWFSEWSQLCEHELGQINPDQYPTASEVRAAAALAAPVIAAEPAAQLD
jgi:TolA-binding protein